MARPKASALRRLMTGAPIAKVKKPTGVRISSRHCNRCRAAAKLAAATRPHAPYLPGRRELLPAACTLRVRHHIGQEV